MISQTSLEAYIYLCKSNKKNANETIVSDVLKKFPEGKTIREISQLLGWTDNRVSGRTKDLKLKGWIVPVCVKINRDTGRPAEVLVAVENYSQALKWWFPDNFGICVHGLGLGGFRPNPSELTKNSINSTTLVETSFFPPNQDNNNNSRGLI